MSLNKTVCYEISPKQSIVQLLKDSLLPSVLEVERGWIPNYPPLHFYASAVTSSFSLEMQQFLAFHTKDYLFVVLGTINSDQFFESDLLSFDGSICCNCHIWRNTIKKCKNWPKFIKKSGLSATSDQFSHFLTVFHQIRQLQQIERSKLSRSDSKNWSELMVLSRNVPNPKLLGFLVLGFGNSFGFWDLGFGIWLSFGIGTCLVLSTAHK
jgi:hypothetical protein